MRPHARTAAATGLIVTCAVALAAGPFERRKNIEARGIEPSVFWTWDTLEPDTLASAWLLLRHSKVSPELRFLPRGDFSAEGTPFDIPLAEFSRTRTTSTFGVLREHLGVEAPGVIAMERLVDEIEITSWEALPSEEAARLDSDLRTIIDGAADPEAALLTATTYLDQLHAALVSHR